MTIWSRAENYLRWKLAPFRPARLEWDPRSGISLSFAGALPKTIATGGKVKLLSLTKAFGHDDHRAKILYLVSSALPPNFRTWIRAAKRSGIPVVLNQNGVAYPAWAGDRVDSINRALREALHSADYVFFQSQFCKTSAELFLGKSRCPGSILFNPVDLEAFTPEASTTLNEKPALRLLLGGSQQQRYRVIGAIDAFARVAAEAPEATLTLAGKIDWSGRPDACAREVRDYLSWLRLVDRVTLHGPYSRDAAPALFREHDILLHTQLNDASPTTVAEAMASGLAIIYSASGGVPEMVGDTAGISVPSHVDYESAEPPSAEAWAVAVLRARRNLAPMKRAARREAELKFSEVEWIRKHGESFQSCLGIGR